MESAIKTERNSIYFWVGFIFFSSLCDGDGPLAAAEMAVDEMCCVWEMPTMKSYRRYVAWITERTKKQRERETCGCVIFMYSSLITQLISFSSFLFACWWFIRFPIHQPARLGGASLDDFLFILLHGQKKKWRSIYVDVRSRELMQADNTVSDDGVGDKWAKECCSAASSSSSRDLVISWTTRTWAAWRLHRWQGPLLHAAAILDPFLHHVWQLRTRKSLSSPPTKRKSISPLFENKWP